MSPLFLRADADAKIARRRRRALAKNAAALADGSDAERVVKALVE